MTRACTNLIQHDRCLRCTDLVANLHSGQLKNFVQINSDEFRSKLLMVFNGSTIDKIAVQQTTHSFRGFGELWRVHNLHLESLNNH